MITSQRGPIKSLSCSCIKSQMLLNYFEFSFAFWNSIWFDLNFEIPFLLIGHGDFWIHIKDYFLIFDIWSTFDEIWFGNNNLADIWQNIFQLFETCSHGTCGH